MRIKTWIIAWTFGFAWTVFMIINNLIINGGLTLNIVVSTLSGGLAAGFLFAWIMQYTAERLVQKVLVTKLPDEAIIKEDGANYFKKKGAVGGKLVLTNRRLIFKSHKFNTFKITSKTLSLDRLNGFK